MIARILFILVMLLALPATAQQLTWWDCGYAWSSEEITKTSVTCIGPTNQDGSCQNWEEIWDDTDSGSGNPIVMTMRFCVNNICNGIPCGDFSRIQPDNAANENITGQQSAWFCINPTKRPTEQIPRILTRCHS